MRVPFSFKDMNKNKSYIYIIENTITNSYYIGVTSQNNYLSRWKSHISKRKILSHLPLYQDMIKFGVKNFSFRVIEELSSKEEAFKREASWISSLKGFGCMLYNICDGGNGSFGLRKDDLWKLNHSNTMSGRKVDFKTKEKISTTMKELIKLEPERKINQSLKVSGEKNGNSKLNTEDIIRIRNLYASGSYTQSKLSEMFGVNQGQIGKIIRKELWKF